MKYYRRVFACFYLLTSIVACRNENLPNTSSPLLTRVVSAIGDSIGYSTFIYDASNQLIGVNDSSSNGNKRQRYFTNYSDSNFTTIKSLTTYASGTTDQFEDTLFYENDKVIRKRNNYSVHKYSYDSRGRLVFDSLFIPGNTQSIELHKFIYNENDDVVEVHSYYNGNSNTFIENANTSASYDLTESPLNNIGLVIYFLDGSDETLSKHKRTQISYNNFGYVSYTGQYTYEYNSAGSITRMSLLRNFGSYSDTYNCDFYYD